MTPYSVLYRVRSTDQLHTADIVVPTPLDDGDVEQLAPLIAATANRPADDVEVIQLLH